MNKQIFVKENDTGFIVVGHSEVACHLRVNGKTLRFQMNKTNVQLFTFDNADATWKPYSFPVLPSEAGLYWDDARKSYYSYADRIDLDRNMDALQRVNAERHALGKVVGE